MIRFFIITFLCLQSSNILSQEVIDLSDYGPVVAEVEAETGILTGVSIDNSIAGYSGDGYVTGFDNSTDILKVTINIPEQDFYKVVIRYNGPSGDKIQVKYPK